MREVVASLHDRCDRGQSMSSEPRDNPAIDDLRRYYAEHADQSRQNESLRATAISILSGFAGAMAGLAATDGLGAADIPVAIIVTVLGGIGFLLSLSHYAKSREHIRILGIVRDRIRDLGGFDTDPVRDAAGAKFRRDQGRPDDDDPGGQAATRPGLLEMLALRTVTWRWWLWALLPLVISLVGIVLLVLAIVGVAPPAK